MALLLSSRSGAKFSMPGMMDTVLNIGLNDETVEGMAQLTQDEPFAFDIYRRLIQMFGHVVLDIPDEAFELVITEAREQAGVRYDSDLSAAEWRNVVEAFKEIIQSHAGNPFPQDPITQLRMAIQAVFKSWNGKRPVDYRNAAHISHDLGTAVNIQQMVFGNMSDNSGTGVLFTRNLATGANELYGDYLMNAQAKMWWQVFDGYNQLLPWRQRCRTFTLNSRKSARGWSAISIMYKTWNLRLSAASCGFSRREMASAQPKQPSNLRLIWPKRAPSFSK